jgi:transposase
MPEETSSEFELCSARAKDFREGRRLRALELIASGYKPSEVARVLGVTPGAVSQWMKRARVGGGAAALLRRKPQGRPRRLTSEQLQELKALLQTHAAIENSGGPRWTTKRVAELIFQKWGVPFSAAHVSRLLKLCDFPTYRATPPIRSHK